MFVADVKCSQATRQTVPNSRTGSAEASVSEAVVRTCTWHRTQCYRRKTEGSSAAFGDEMDIISQVRRHLTAQCLAHQTGEFEPHGRWYHRADRQTYTDDINMKQNRSTDCETSQHIMTCEFITGVSDSHVLGRRSVEDEQTEHIDIPHTIETCTPT